MKKSLSLLVAIAMVFSMFATLVSADTASAGQKLLDNGIIKGTNEGLEEGAEWKRQDVTVLISRLLKKEEEAKAHANTHGFEDLNSTFYNGYVSWAKENNFFIGKSETKFGVNEPITNQEFATVVLRVVNALQGKTEEVDYATAFETATELGFVAKDLDPKANAIRGDIYVSLVSVLDHKIDGKTIGNLLGLSGYEITELAIASVGAVVKSSVNVEFNTEVADLKSEDVTVEDADGNAVLVEKVTVNGAKATVALSDELASGKTYTLKVASATSAEGAVLANASAEFKYEASTPATLELAATTVAVGDELKVIVKDANGNDISSNYTQGDFEVQSSNVSYVNGFDAIAVGEAIVNVKLEVDEDTTIETGNQIITVKAALSASITDVSFAATGSDTDADDNDVKVFAKEKGQIVFTAKDQGDNEYGFAGVATADIEDPSFKSLNPARLVVDAKDGTYEAIQEGSATVQISAKVKGVSVTKSVVVTIQAEQKVSSISVSESSVKLVEGATEDIEYSFVVKTLDQYGDKYADDDAEIEVASSKTEYVTAALADDADITEGEAKVVLAGVKNGSSTIKVTVKVGDKTFTKSITASQVAKNGFGGYIAEAGKDTLDVTPTSPKKEDGATATTTITVYEKDKNGNKYALASDNADVYFLSSDAKVATVGITSGEVTAVKAGTVTVTVKVGELAEGAEVNEANVSKLATVATVKLTVVHSAPVLTKVVQAKQTITVTDETNIKDLLFGKNGALVVTDQYGDNFDNDGLLLSGEGKNVSIATSNASVIAEDLDVEADETAKATITVVINSQIFVVNVNVKK